MARLRKARGGAEIQHGDDRSWKRTEVIGKLLERSGVPGRVAVMLVIAALVAIVVMRVS